MNFNISFNENIKTIMTFLRNDSFLSFEYTEYQGKLFDVFFDKYKIFKIKSTGEKTIINTILKCINNIDDFLLNKGAIIFGDNIEKNNYEIIIICYNVNINEVFMRLSLNINHTEYLYYDFKEMKKKEIFESKKLLSNLDKL